jgi:hypothetical protein
VRLPKGARASGAVLVAVTLVVAVLAYLALASDSSDLATGAGAGLAPIADGHALKSMPAGSRILVRAANPRAPREDGLLYELSASGGVRQVGELECKRVYAIDGGDGLCLTRAANDIGYDGVVFDDGFDERARFVVHGVPDRARISPDGRYGAYTAFDVASAEGYFASTSEFEVTTRIFDMRSGRSLVSLESLELEDREGRPLEAADRQLWGVAFAGGDRYYATLATGDDHLLIEGRVGSDSARVVARDVECPALAPDGRRIAYKRRIGDSNRWRLHVRDLSSGSDIALAETRSIDDQPEWLGDDVVLYSDDRALFAVAADGSGGPRLLARRATSPVGLAP